MTINIFMHIYIGENAHWDIYAPPWQKHCTIFFSIFLFYFFYFRCILLQISHQKCFFISISIPGRSGVKDNQSIGCQPKTFQRINNGTCMIIKRISSIFRSDNVEILYGQFNAVINPLICYTNCYVLTPCVVLYNPVSSFVQMKYHIRTRDYIQ